MPSAVHRPSVQPGGRAPRPSRLHGRRGLPPVPGASCSGTNHDQPSRALRVQLSGGNRTTAAPFGHGSDRRWGDSAPGTSMPGAAVCWSGLCPRLARNVHQLLRVGLTVVCARMHRAPTPQPQQASERRPGPPAGCPPCRAGRSGAPAPRTPFTFPCAGGAYLRRWPPPRYTSVPQAQPVRGGWPRVGDDRLVARVRAGDDAAFEIIYDRYYRGLLAFCGHMLGSRQEAEDALQHSFASAYRALRGRRGRHRAAPLALHDRAQPLPVGPARAARAGLRRRAGGRLRILRGDVGPGPAPRRPARAGGGAAAPARRPARRAGPLRARRPVARADRGGARGAPREGQGARLPGARGADARARRPRDSVRRDPRAARHGRRPRPPAQRAAPAHRPLSRAARTSSARSAASAPRSRRSCRWCRPWA